MFLLKISSHFTRELIVLLLFISGLHPNPGPAIPQGLDFKLLQFNTNGIRNSCAELATFLVNHDIKVACIQESKLSSKSKTPPFPGYAVVRRDRPVGNGGGLVILVQDSIPYTNIDISLFSSSSLYIELLAVRVDVSEDLNLDIFNVYIPPASALNNFTPDFDGLLSLSGMNPVFLGDFNAHHSDWYSPLSDSRGDLLAESVDSTGLFVLNNDSPTRLPKAANQGPSSPDVTLVPAHLASSFNWITHTTLNSDHLPITVSLSNSFTPSRIRRSFTNYKKADWAGYIREIELRLTNTSRPTSCAKGERVFRDILKAASNHNIPSGFRKDFIPGLPADAKHLIQQRDELRSQDPCDPEITVLNDDIAEAIRIYKR
jgi:hypothetical protein